LPPERSFTGWGAPGFDFAFVAPDRRFSATAARIRALNASASIASPSRMSIARRTLPSRPELKRRDGSGRLAPFAKVSLTTFL
jgi:hypothetical protein